MYIGGQLKHFESVRSRIPTILIILSLLLFSSSLTQVAVSYHAEGRLQSYSGLEMFLIGPIAFFGSGTYETLIWLANPLYFLSIILFRVKKRMATYGSSVALTLAVLFGLRRRLLMNEGGNTTEIVHFGTGYWLWICSLALLCAAVYLMRILNRDSSDAAV